MPKYKLPNGKIVTIEDVHVEAFLESKDSEGAVLVQEGPTPVEQEIEIPGVNFDDYLKPAKTQDSASADPAVESEDTGSNLVDGSLEQQDVSGREIKIPEPNKQLSEEEVQSTLDYIDNIGGVKDPVAKDVITLLNGSEYDKKKNRFKRSNKEAKLFRQDAVEVTKAMRQMYDGLGLEFNTKFEDGGFGGGGFGGGFISGISSGLMGQDIDDDTVVVSLGDKKINLETNTTDDVAYIRNLKKIEDLITDNKESLNVEQWTSNVNKTIEDYKKIESIDKSTKEAEKQAKVDFIDNPTLFDPVEKTTNIQAGPYSYYGQTTVMEYPYEEELNKIKSTLLDQNPNIDKGKLEESVKNIVRQNLAEEFIVNAKYNAREQAISNGDVSQEMLYTTSAFLTSDKAKKYNESAKKADISEGIAVTSNSALNLAYKSLTVGLDEGEDLDLIEAIDELGFDFNYSDNTKVKLKNGREVNKQLFDLYPKLLEKNKAAKINFNKHISKAEENADSIDDLNLSMEASSKNYDLSEKYLANIGVGFTDLGAGLLRTGAEVLRLDGDGALDDLGASYSEWSQDIRGSFVRDVAFDDAFSSAENFGKFAAQEITNQIPILATLAASGGTAAPYVIGASSMGSKLNDMSYEIAKGTAEYSKSEMYLKSLGYGVAEGAFSALPTSRILKNTKARWISGSKTKGTSLLDDGVKSWVKEKTPGLLLDTGMETFGEGLTTLTQNLIDGKSWYENIDHAAFSGFGFSLGMGGVPYARGLYNSTFSTYGSNKTIRDKKNSIDELSKRYKSLDGRTKEAKVIKSEIKKLSDEVNDVIISNEKLVNNHLTYKGADYILKIENAKADIQNEAKNIVADNTISPDVKNLRLATLKERLSKIDDVEQTVKSDRSFKMNLVEFNAFKFDNEAKYNEYKEKAESFLIDEGFDKPKSELIEKKAQEYYFTDEVRKDNAINSKKSSAFNGNFKSFETKEEALKYVNTLPETDISDKEKAEITEVIQNGGDGFAVRDKNITVAIVENQVANQRKQVRTHEVGHQALEAILNQKDNTGAIEVIANQIKHTLRKTDRKLYNKFVKQFALASEMNDPREVVARFTELVADNEITFSERKKGIAGLFGAMVQKKFSDKYDFNFRGENDMFNFVVGFGRKIKSGEFTTEDIEAARESEAVKTAIEKGSNADAKTNKQTSFSKSVEDIQSEIFALEDLYDEQRIDYYEYEGKMDALEAQLEQARKAPKEKPKTTKAAAKVNVSDIEEQIDALNNDFYDGVIDEIEHEQKLDILEAKLNQAKLQVSKPKEAKKQQEKIVKDSVEKFKKEASEETVSDRNKNIAKINEDIANEMLELGANKVTDIKDPVKQKEIIDKLGRNNLGAVTNLTKKATAAGKDLAIDDNLKVGYDEFFSGFSEELSALIKSYKVEVDGKKVPFGAYMNKNLPLRYGQILDKALKGRIEGAKSLDVNSGEKGFAGTIAAEGSADFDAATSADRGLPAGELIDVTTFRKVKDKVENVKESIDLTDVDIDGLTYRKIQDDYSGDVGAEIIGLWDKKAEPEKGQDRNDFQKLAERIEGTRTLNYGKDTGGEAEVRAMQGLFLDYNDAVKFIKTIPEFNVAPFETTIDKQGKSIDLTESARGYSTGISNKLLKKFYEPYIDPKATNKDKDVKKTAITSPSGRGKGKTSQVAKVYRLKPEYRGSISRQTVQELQKTIGITPAGEAFIPMKGPNRTEFGTALQGLTKMYATNVANTVIRKKIVDEGITSETKPTEKVLADIGGGKSRVMFSKNKQIETALKYIPNTEELFSRFNTEEALKGSDKDFNKFKAVFKTDVKEFLKYIPSGYRPSNFVGIYSTDIIYKNLSDKEKTIFKNRVAELQSIAKQEMANNNGQAIGFNSPTNEMGSTLPQVEETFKRKNIKDKVIKKNKKYEKAFDDMWLGTYEAVKNNPNLIPIASLFIEGAAYDVAHPHRRGANFIGYQTNVSPQKNNKGLYRTFEYEHAVQSNIMASELYEAMFNLKDVRQFKEFLNISKADYKMIALGVLDNKKLEKAGYRFKMPKNWSNWWDRYLNEEVAKIDGGIDPKSIMVLNDKNQLVTLFELAGNVDSSGRKVSFSKGRLDTEFNKILENKTGILASDNISEVKAKMMADKKRKVNFFIPPSAEDFVGLLYATLGKGSVGDKQMKFYDRTLLRPYARAMQAITRDRIDLGRAFKNIRKEFKATPKDLKKKVHNSLFTKEQAVRVYIWDSIGKEVPGLSVEEANELANYVADNKQLKDFAEQVMRLNPGSKYASPKDTWTTGTITTDLLETLNESRRAKHLARWQQNVDEIFSTENLNKLEAAYGTKYRKAMENMLTRMKTGRNRTYGTDTQTAKWIDWMNGSVGAIMFLNARSAVLQTISSANFVNFGDNNVIAAGKAFANQKQYWTDFVKLINSDYLLERRDSLKINVNEADIAEAASKNGARGAINYLLKLGFTPTKFADSFAIASGGATFYRNRIEALIKSGMDPVAAEKAAMRDFIEKSEESQQSSRPDKISQEQAGPLGRVVLAFANTPAQYARIIKKAASDLKNRRGSDKENISKILYYSVAQNLMFNALQQAIFAVAFGDEEDEGVLDDKKLNVVNGMLDGIIRGTGIAGAVFSVVKNTGLKIYKETEKKNPKYENMVFEAMKISPPISSKVSKIRSAGRTMSWDMKEIKAKGLDITSPAIGAGAQVVSATTNLPLDRAIRKIENLKAASDSELETYKRLALVLGWGKWELGIEDEKWKDPNAKPKSKSKVRKTKVRKVKIRR
jgi:hypothetical protein